LLLLLGVLLLLVLLGRVLLLLLLGPAVRLPAGNPIRHCGCRPRDHGGAGDTS
jgi:hypothetical protein